MFIKDISPLYVEFPMQLPTVTPVVLVNAAGLVLSFVLIAWLLKRNPNNWLRSAFQFGVLASIVFQCGATFFSNVLWEELERPIGYLLSIHLFVLGCFAWVLATPRMTPELKEKLEPRDSLLPNVQLGVSLAAFALLSVIYLGHVGVACTGLYALLFDSEVALIARDLSIKFVKNAFASYAIAFNINAIGPIAIISLGLFFTRMILQRRVLPSILAILSSFIVIAVLAVIMVNGAKGNLLPTLVVAVIVLLLRSQTWRARFFSVAVVVAMAFVAMLGLELSKEVSLKSTTRNQSLTEKARLYPLGACLARIDACPEGAKFIRFFENSSGYIGVDRSRMPYLVRDVETHCPKEFEDRAGRMKWDPLVEYVDTRGVQGWWKLVQRVKHYSISIARRILIVPVQIGAWHFQYADEFGSPGLRYLPGVSNLFGGRIGDMPNRVHDAYLGIYSNSSTIPSGTSPTSFFISAASYLGVGGFCLAMVLILTFDIVGSFLLHHMRGETRLLAIAILAVANVNLLLTEFWTTMVSHGTLAGIGLLGLITVFAKVIQCRRSSVR